MWMMMRTKLNLKLETSRPGAFRAKPCTAPVAPVAASLVLSCFSIILTLAVVSILKLAVLRKSKLAVFRKFKLLPAWF